MAPRCEDGGGCGAPECRMASSLLLDTAPHNFIISWNGLAHNALIVQTRPPPRPTVVTPVGRAVALRASKRRARQGAWTPQKMRCIL